MVSIVQNLEKIKNNIIDAAARFGRNGNDITLIAVSKNHPSNKIEAAFDAGQRHFGESYVQEALRKMQELNNEKIIWHFIGKIQSNKAKLLANNFSWVQSVTSKESAELLNKYRLENLSPLNICIEVNLSNEFSKAGVALDGVFALANAIANLPRLKLRGLMAIPAPREDFNKQVETFSLLTDTVKQLNSQYNLNLDTLSMGMSDDYAAAIAAGSTMIRIGTAIFGEREYSRG
jgi:hypothetical protein